MHAHTQPAAMPEIVINGRRIGPSHPPFTIAEVGLNHNGDIDKALEMVRVAHAAGATAVKFQTFKASEFVGNPNQTYTYRSQGVEITESMLAMFQRCELRRDHWFTLKAECDRLGILFMSTPQNRSDLDILLEVGVPAVKIGSDDFTNLPLLRSYAATGLPIILSCGMADMAEIYRSLDTVGAFDGYPIVLLLCTSQYPTPPEDVNLAKLRTLRAAFPQLTLGFSDHTEGPLASSVAVAFGASVFEKHFTLSHDLPGPDHWFSETPETLRAWIYSITTAHRMMGTPVLRPTAAEREMRRIARRSIVALREIAKGDKLTAANVAIRRPATGLPPELLEAVLGRTATRALQAGEPVTLRDITS
jgi:N,N'-diacetyllegionaminate synthase